MDDLIRVLLGSILLSSLQDLTRNHNLVRAYPRQRHRVNRRVQRTLRTATMVNREPSIASAHEPTEPPVIELSYRPMEPSPPHSVLFTPVARSDDLGWFYGWTIGGHPFDGKRWCRPEPREVCYTTQRQHHHQFEHLSDHPSITNFGHHGPEP
jgi:hypothetical protein